MNFFIIFNMYWQWYFFKFVDNLIFWTNHSHFWMKFSFWINLFLNLVSLMSNEGVLPFRRWAELSCLSFVWELTTNRPVYFVPRDFGWYTLSSQLKEGTAVTRFKEQIEKRRKLRLSWKIALLYTLFKWFSVAYYLKTGIVCLKSGLWLGNLLHLKVRYATYTSVNVLTSAIHILENVIEFGTPSKHT